MKVLLEFVGVCIIGGFVTALLTPVYYVIESKIRAALRG